MPPPHVPWWSPRFARAYVVTMRPYLLFVSGAAGLAGISFAPDQAPGRVFAAFLPLFLSYGFGQALTDCFQTDTDSLSAPYRPLVRGDVSRRQVLIVSLAGLVGVVLALAYVNPSMLALGALAVVGLLTYTRLKRTWWGGPPWNAWIVALLPIMGRLSERGYRLPRLVDPSDAGVPALAAAVSAVFMGYANFVVMGYMKDVSADRATGYRTFPVAFGWRPAVLYGDVTAAAALAMSARSIALSGANVWALILLGAGLVLHVRAQAAMHMTRDETKVGGPIADGVRALTLYCLAITASNKVEWIPLLVAFYALFELTLRVRPEEAQV